MEIPDLLKAIAAAAKVKQTGLGSLIGVSQPQISRYMSGSQPLKPAYDKIKAAARQYRIHVDDDDDMRSEDVSAGMDREERPKIKVKGYVGAGGAMHYYAVSQGDLGEIDPSDRDPADAAAVQIMGTSLGRFFDRWYAVYTDVRAPITADLIGKLCVVGLDDDRVLIKKVIRNGNRFDLMSNSEEEEPIRGVKIKWAALVSDIRQS